jgi:hypothetical protein
VSTSRVRDAGFLITLLTQSLGAAVAGERVRAVVKKLHFDATALTEEQALASLEELAKERGIAGSAARFAKVRLMLIWNQP